MNGMYFDIQRFSDNNSSIDSLERLGNVINALDLKNLADEFLNSGKTVTKFLKDNVNPILKFIGTFLEAKAEKKSDTAKKFENYSTVITSTAIIVDSALAVVKYAKEKNTDKVSTNIGLIASELTKMVKAVVSLNSGSGKASLILGIVASTTSLVANGISALDGLDDNEKAEINKAYVELMKSFGPDLVKKIFNDAIASEIKKASVKDLEVVKKNISLFNNVSNTLTKAGGVLDLVFALTNGVMNGIDKYKVTLKKYTEDNIPEDMAKRDAFIDAITTVIHDTAHTYTKGLDDVLFRGTQTLVSWITGKQPGNQGNYVEVITDMFKAFNFTNSGTADGDYLLSFEDNMMIYGMDGNDYIGNIFSRVMIYGGHDNDTIVSRLGSGDGYSTPQGNSFFGGPGEDLFMVYDTSSTIDGGTDSDRIAIFGKNNKIYGDNGTDAILLESGADGNTISGGLGDDAILLNNAKNTVIEYNEGDGNDIILGYDESDEIRILADYSASINGQDVIIGVGNDSITLSGAAGKTININNKREVIGEEQEGNTNAFIPIPSFWYPGVNEIRSTAGNDKIKNTLNSIMINSGAGNDSIENYGFSVTISGGDNSDTIRNWSDGTNTSITGNNGNDSICNRSDFVTISGGDGDDYLDNGDGHYFDYYSHYGGSNVSISGGNGNDSIWNDGYSATINGDDGNDAIYNDWRGTDTSLSGGSGDDRIQNGGMWNGYSHYGGSFVTITGGDGNDRIYNDYGGYKASISGGAGNNYICNYLAYNVTISGGDDDDSIINGSIRDNGGNYILINSGAGNNYVSNYHGESVTINCGVGNDSIDNEGSFVTIDSGSGNDSISNSGKNVLFNYTAGDGNDTIWGFNSSSTLSISGGEYVRSTVGNDVIITVEDGSILLKDAKGKTLNIDGEEADEPVWTLNNTTATYGTKNKTLITVSGVKSLAGISLRDKIVTISATSLNNSEVKISGDGYTLALGNDVTKTSTANAGWNLSGSTATYKIASTSAGYKLEDNKISYVSASNGGILVTVNGVKSLNGLSLNNKVVTVSNSALNQKTVTVSNGYTLALGNDVPKATSNEIAWTLSRNTATLIQRQSIGYVCNGSSITYSSKATTATLATLTGVQSIDGLSIDGNVITLSEDALDSSTVKLTKGNYKLALDDSVIAKPITEPTWFISGTKATYKDGNSAYYSLASNGKSVNFVKAAADKKAKDLITLSGVNKNFSADDVEIDEDNKVITLSASALDKKNVTIGGSENYSLALADNVTKATVSEPEWNLKKTTATLSQKQSIGYVCNGGSITYSSKATTATLATLTGVQSIDGLSVDGNVITLSEDALGSSTIKLTKGNYKLELDDSVIAKPITEPTWFISGNKATYKDGNSAYYSLASNGKSVNFIKAAADKKAKDLITLNGINKNFSADDIELDEDNMVVTLSNNALNKKTVTIGGSEDYSLALAYDVKEATVGEPQWTLKNTTATLSQKQSVGYVCNGGSITYSSKAATVTLATLTGVQSVDGLSVDDNIITLSEDALGSSTVKLTKGNYKLELDDNVATEPTTEPTWFISGNKTTYKDGNSAYYSLASNGKSVNFVKAAADKKAKDLITLNGVNKNFSADDVEIDENNKVITLSASSLDKKNVTIGGTEDYSLALGDDVPEVTLGKPKLEVKGSKATLTQSTSIGYVLTNDKTITYSKKVSATTLATVTGVKSKSGIFFDQSSITLSNSALTNKVTVSGDVSFEFKANYKNASITGSKDDDVISVLGTGVSVTGGKGDDYLTSGGGNTFIYASGDGDDVIADFTSSDKLKITNGDFSVDTDGSDVIVSVTKGKVTGSITLSNAAGQSITIIDSKNKGHLFFTSASDFNYWFDEDSFDTKSDISTIANSSDTNCQVGALNNLSEMNHKLNSFDSFSDEEKYFVTYCDKK